MSYLDGFVIPVPHGKKPAYAALAQRLAPLFLEYGATRVVEAWADDIRPGKINDFRTAVLAEESATVVFSWVEWPSKAARDAAQPRIMADPRMQPDGEMPFEGKRAIMGGFAAFVDQRSN